MKQRNTKKTGRGILAARWYATLPGEVIAWTEDHLEKVRRLKLKGSESLLRDRYIERMIQCQSGRRCNLRACPQCSQARGASMAALLARKLTRYPGALVVSIDALLHARDRLYDKRNSPQDDLRQIRKILRSALPLRMPNSHVFVLGSYEISVSRNEAKTYSRQTNRNSRRTRSVIPHAHLLAFVAQDEKFLTREAVRDRLKVGFPEARQLHTRYLDSQQTLEQAISRRMAYVCKARTSEFTGRALQDFVIWQMTVPQRSWEIYLKHPAHNHTPTAQSLCSASVVFSTTDDEPSPDRAPNPRSLHTAKARRPPSRKCLKMLAEKSHAVTADVAWELVFEPPPIAFPEGCDMRDDGLYVRLRESNWVRIAGPAVLSVEEEELRISFAVTDKGSERRIERFRRERLEHQHRLLAATLRRKGFFIASGKEELTALVLAEVLRLNRAVREVPT